MPDGPPARTELRLLGGAALFHEDAPVEGPAARRHPRALLALLATAPSGTLSRAKALGLLWPETDESTARNRLTSTLYPLRQAMGAEAVVSAAGQLRLDRALVSCDLWRFREALDRGDPRAAAEGYRGPFLDGFYLEGNPAFEEYVELERHRLHRAWREAVESLARAATEAGRHTEAVRWWETLSRADLLDSSVHSGLVRAHLAAGNPAAALRAGEAHVRRLREELGMEPGESFAALLAEVASAGSRSGVAPGTPPLDPRPGVAVLPFRSVGEENAPFADGLHGGILTRLSELAGLSVIARGSLERFRDTDEPASAVGAALGVEWTLEGEVQVAEGAFEVNVRLVHAPDDRVVWGRSWSGSFSADTVFGAQADIAHGVVASLPLAPSPGERLLLAQRPTESLDAFRLASQGRRHLERRTREEMERAVACFAEALERDPDFAPARVGLADALGLLHSYGFRDVSVLPRVEAALVEALEAAPWSAEAHAALGRLRGQQRRAGDASRHMRRAIELQPGYAEAHNWAAVGHLVDGDRLEALASARRAVSLNPLSPEVIYNLGMGLLVNGHPEEALQEARRARELSQGYESARFLEGMILREMGRADAAAQALEGLEVPWAGDAPRTVLALARIDLGEKKEARSLADEVADGGHPFDQGLILAALGEADAAFEAFARESYERMETAVTYWPTVALRHLFADVWDRLRGDPRYPRLVARIDGMWEA
ncbi:MAG: BTAD domain-containing putative transcriptional regulator [Gemmatimonadota bacterium]